MSKFGNGQSGGPISCNGEMAGLITGFDWGGSSLGPVAGWDFALTTVVNLMLSSPHPMFLVWGPEMVWLHNDAFIPIAANRHPSALGRTAPSVCAEAWTDLEPLFKKVFLGEAVQLDDLALQLERYGRVQEAHFTITYVPVRGIGGEVEGLLGICSETTEAVLSRRTRESEASRLAELFRQTPSFMAQLSGPEHRFTFANESYHRLTGHRDVIGKTAREAFPDIEGQGFFELLDQVYTSGIAHKGDGVPVRFQRSSGADSEERIVDFIFEPIKDVNGQVTGILADGYDVTESRRAQRFRDAIGSLNDNIRDLVESDAIAYAGAKLLGETLGVSRAGYGTINIAEETITIERDWNAPGIKSLAGILHFRDYGSYIEDLKAGRTVVFGDAEVDPRTREGAAALKAISAQSVVNMPVTEQGGFVALLYLNHHTARPWQEDELDFVREVAERIRTATERRRAEQELREEAQALQILNKTGAAISAKLDLSEIVQVVTDAGVELTGAEFGAFFYNVLNDAGESYTLYTLSGVPREAFSKFPMPRNTAIFAPTFAGEGTVRSDDILKDPRYGHNAPHKGMPEGHLPVRSYLAVPVRSRTGEVLGGLFFGHPQPGIFGPRAEKLMTGLAGQASIAIDNARLFDASQKEIAQRKSAEEDLVRLNLTLEDRIAEEVAQRGTAEERFRLLIQSVTDYAIYMLGTDGRVSSWNPGAERFKGYSAGEIIGEHFSRFYTEEDKQADNPRTALETAEREGRFEAEGWRVRKDGSRFWASVIIDPVRTEDGRLIGFAKVTRDLTEKRETEERLRQSQKMEAVGQLTGGLAHDFNNLLAGISGSMEMMQVRLAQGRAQEVDRYFMAAQGALKRAAALTHRLLAFSRRQTLDPRPTSTNRLLSGLEELVRRTVGPSIEVEVVLASGAWPVLVDANQLENAILNLCINARDAMTDGGKLTIESANKWVDERAARQHDLPEGQYVSVCVTDTGTGMSPDVIAKAFEPFFTTKPLGEGTGLGLSMVYGFARQSGGQVRVYSEVGQGTTMCIYLPRHNEDATADNEPEISSRSQSTGEGEVVLVIDDEPTIRMLIGELLADAGYAVIEAPDGPAGLKVLESNARIDLLITDVGLPGGMNGRQVADAARVSRPNLKVLFITGYAENAVLGKGRLEKGMFVATKPFNMDALAARIRDIIKQ